MSTEPRRVQFSVRVRERDKQVFSDAAERCGMDPSVAVRTLVELAVQRVEAGGDFIDALHELKTAWRVPRQDEIEKALSQDSAEADTGE